MDFGTQIRELRKNEKLTQEQFAAKLNVTRQAVSNWENNKNLDIEMVLRISQTFHIPLEELIYGGKQMNNMTAKLVQDGKETTRTRMNLISTLIGCVLMGIGLMLFGIKAASVEYIDAQGILHENFFLIPSGFLFMTAGAVVIIAGIARAFIHKKRHKSL